VHISLNPITRTESSKKKKKLSPELCDFPDLDYRLFDRNSMWAVVSQHFSRNDFTSGLI